MGASRIALVTGAGKGLGRAIALAFARRKYHVAVHAFASEAGAAETVKLVADVGALAIAVRGDLRDSSQAEAVVRRVAEQWDRVDVLVNNAGSVRNHTIARLSDDDWREVLASNLDSAFFMTRSVIPLMRREKDGAIINVTSFLAEHPVRGAANYAAAKAALIALTKATAAEEGRNNIRSNAVLPGFHVTDLNRDVWEKNEAAIRAGHLLSALPDRDEMADFVVSVAELNTVSGQVFAFESRIG